jgi:hypothetical protein
MRDNSRSVLMNLFELPPNSWPSTPSSETRCERGITRSAIRG